ncbi:MAG: hypothetical protein WC867_04105 [Candidatus Pacearchaeota archaeon]|jgi:lipopolysaccharide export LptBFGC system permease protein LptF
MKKGVKKKNKSVVDNIKLDKKKDLVKSDKKLAIISLVTNMILPGVGTYLSGKRKEGLLQIFMYLQVFVVIFSLLSILKQVSSNQLFWPLFVSLSIALLAWVWGLWIGIALIKEAKDGKKIKE